MRQYDLIVIGAGAAGMAAAATAVSLGLRVLLLEAESRVGGTTAISAGSVWVPNALAVEADPDAAGRYLRAACGNHGRPEMRRAFLRRGPEAIRHLQDAGALDLVAYRHHPDYLGDLPGAVTSGRALGARPFDGRRLGKALAMLRPPLPEFTIFGGMMVDRADIAHLMNVGQSLASLRHATGLILRHVIDRLHGPRGRRLVMGNALAGRLLAFLLERDVTVCTSATVEHIALAGGRATGVVVAGEEISARLGVVVACGGFSHHPRLRGAHYPKDDEGISAAPESNRGGGVDLLLAAGGRLETGHTNAAFWAPASIRRRPDGSRAVFPHFVLDRAKPGIFAIDRTGRRFVDESTSYQRFVEAMYRSAAIPCHLICSAAFIRRHGLGVIRPMTRNPRRWVAEGYLSEGRTLAELAGVIGVDAAAFAETAARHDRHAAEGRDPDFHRGETAYARNLGDPAHGPNPCLGPLGDGPYYAIEIHPADIGTSIGIATDGDARVLDARGAPIPGLYAAGNDMASVMAGAYPGPGITLGPAITFGYLAARHAASTLET